MTVRILVAERGPMAGHLHRSLRATAAETVAIDGGTEPEPSYMEEADYAMVVPSLNRAQDLVAAALDAGCDAVHPGVGPDAESPDLARACMEASLGYLGPLPEQIAALADRWTTREIAIAAGVPVVPSSSPIYNLPELEEPVQRLGYPLWVKDTWGLEAVLAESDVELARLVRERIHSGQQVWVEGHIPRARHVVVSFAGDEEGEVVPFGVRDRALRRMGKLSVDRFPAPIEADLAATVEAAAVTFAEAVRYTGVGTVGFLVDDSGAAYCIGLRPRLDLGALLNDIVHGIRLAELQLRMAGGDDIGWDQEDLEPKGHAIGIRLRADKRGILKKWRAPEGVTLHSHLVEGSVASGLLGVLVVHGPTAQASVVRAVAALRDLEVEGVDIGRQRLVEAISEPRFWTGEVLCG
ncbi:MAG TPA: biotin carboxylase N-terminal domain-containing protein [Myxococcota bacterium]|nr:biotin carboxylase N-terminal domain-containing protein [Myxococcota bacterium]